MFISWAVKIASEFLNFDKDIPLLNQWKSQIVLGKKSSQWAMDAKTNILEIFIFHKALPMIRNNTFPDIIVKSHLMPFTKNQKQFTYLKTTMVLL